MLFITLADGFLFLLSNTSMTSSSWSELLFWTLAWRFLFLLGKTWMSSSSWLELLFFKWELSDSGHSVVNGEGRGNSSHDWDVLMELDTMGAEEDWVVGAKNIGAHVGGWVTADGRLTMREHWGVSGVSCQVEDTCDSIKANALMIPHAKTKWMKVIGKYYLQWSGWQDYHQQRFVSHHKESKRQNWPWWVYPLSSKESGLQSFAGFRWWQASMKTSGREISMGKEEKYMSFLSNVLSDLPSECNPGGITIAGLNAWLDVDSSINYQMWWRKQIDQRLCIAISWIRCRRIHRELK